MFHDDYNVVEPFSQSEFAVHNDRELRNLDAGRDSDCVECPDCGKMVRIRDGDTFVTCRNCGCEFDA